MKKAQTLSIIVLGLSPALVSAQGYFGQIDDFFLRVQGFIGDILIPLIFAAALLMFIYGMFKFFILGGHNKESQEEGKQLILWAVIGLVLMVSIWGIVNIIAGGLFGASADAPELPTLPGSPSGNYAP